MFHMLIREYRRHTSKLLYCFVDFMRAFDTVHRGVLWAVLQKLGVCGAFLRCLQSMYAQDSRGSQNRNEPIRYLQMRARGASLLHPPTALRAYA